MASKDQIAEENRLKGNECFKEDKFHQAIQYYTAAIEAVPSPNLYCNRAFAYIKVELPGGALMDAEEAIKLEPGFAKAYYRKASAHLLMGKFKEALKDFEIVRKLVPTDEDAKKRWEECDKKVRQIRFEKAIKAKENRPISETINIGTVQASYTGPRIGEDGITVAFVREMREHFREEKKIDRHDAVYILLEVLKLFQNDPNVVEIQKPNRFREIPESGPICESLWADPQPMPGRTPSKRGVNCPAFGPDVTARFLERNNLKLVVRSHEVKDNGYEIEHGGKCVTVFSAPNYCDQMKNKGAVVQFTGGDMKPKYVVYSESKHPGKGMMYYASRGFGL
eukprot:gene12514-8569_t